RNAHAALAEALAAEPDRAVWHRAAAASEPGAGVPERLHAAANRAMLRGAGDVAVSAFERAAELSEEPQRRAVRLYLAGELAREVGRVWRWPALHRRRPVAGGGPLERRRAIAQRGAADRASSSRERDGLVPSGDR